MFYLEEDERVLVASKEPLFLHCISLSDGISEIGNIIPCDTTTRNFISGLKAEVVCDWNITVCNNVTGPPELQRF